MGIMKNCKKLLSVIVTLLLAASLLTSSAFAISGEAFIATPGEVNLRDSGSFNSNVIDAAPQGATVYVLGDARLRLVQGELQRQDRLHGFLLPALQRGPVRGERGFRPGQGSGAGDHAGDRAAARAGGSLADLRCASRDRRQQRHRSRLRHLLPQRPEHLQQRDRNA